MTVFISWIIGVIGMVCLLHYGWQMPVGVTLVMIGWEVRRAAGLNQSARELAQLILDRLYKRND